MGDLGGPTKPPHWQTCPGTIQKITNCRPVAILAQEIPAQRSAGPFIAATLPMKTMKATKAMKTMKVMRAMKAIKKAMKAAKKVIQDMKALKAEQAKKTGWRLLRQLYDKVKARRQLQLRAMLRDGAVDPWGELEF